MKRLFLAPALLILLLSCGQQNSDGQKDREKTTTDTTAELNELLPELKTYTKKIVNEFTEIPESRKEKLRSLASYINRNYTKQDSIQLVFICTHNSRRSHMSQFWAQTAAYSNGLKNVYCFSGGTEATAFNPRAVKALRMAGFQIAQTDSTSNPVYQVTYSDNAEPIQAFSKKYDHEFNPQTNFLAVMTCSQADKECPVVYGAKERFAVPYEDPKVADNTPQEELKYNERCQQIATEMFYLFSNVNL